ncbi:hypothetical protein HY745_07900 [Candidatus Desantisbacteria bacterium]|nr:hypothetical protein [Candidatus Desantisbacteria bacterium]
MFNAKQKVLYLRGDLKEEKHYQTLKITKMKEYEEFKAMFDKEKKILKKMIIKYYKEMPEWLKEVTKLELK